MRTLLLSAVTAAAALGQTPKPADPAKAAAPAQVAQNVRNIKVDAKPPTLAEAIAAAMQSNPDVRVAAAEVDLARAKLEQVKMQTTAKIIIAFAAKQAAAESLRESEKFFVLAKEHSARGVLSARELSDAEVTLAQAKAAAAAADANYDALVGPAKPIGIPSFHLASPVERLTLAPVHETNNVMRQAPSRPNGLATVVPVAIADQLKSMLDKTVSAKLEAVPAKDFFEWLTKETGGKLAFKIQNPENAPKVTVTGTLTVGALLQMVEDDEAWTKYGLYVREYGLLLCDRRTAPDDAMTVGQFWKTMK